MTPRRSGAGTPDTPRHSVSIAAAKTIVVAGIGLALDAAARTHTGAGGDRLLLIAARDFFPIRAWHRDGCSELAELLTMRTLSSTLDGVHAAGRRH